MPAGLLPGSTAIFPALRATSRSAPPTRRSGSPAERPMTTAPLEAPEFAALIGALAPFELAPRLAVGVSGGADSMALTLLAQAWAQARGGAVWALTVDHGLRPEAAAEARQVGAWLGARGIEHRILAW